MSELKKVLIADDDKVLVETLAAVLRAKRIRVTTAADAMQAVMYAVKELPDAILLDIGMPGGTGRTALKKLHENRKTALIPVVVLTGEIDPELPGTVKTLGGAFMRKPARPAEVLGILEEVVERRANLIEHVFQAVRGNGPEEIATALAGQGIETSPQELDAILDYLQAHRRVLKKDGLWYVA